MPATTLFVHIPVDTIDIVDGPSALVCSDILKRLTRGEQEIEVPMKLRTGASKLEYWRKIKIHSIFYVGNQYQFTAIFQGQIVSGNYSARTRSGWFSLD